MQASWFPCLLLCLLMIIARVHCQVVHGGSTLDNHSYVDLVTIRNPLSCTTTLTTCCRGSQWGTWVRPNGISVTTSGSDVYQRYGERKIDLYVTSAVSGMYRCDIQTHENGERDSYYVGLYNRSNGEGRPSATISLTKVPGQSPRFTFTCVSIGGPVTTVSWYYDSNDGVMGDRVLNNPVTAQYTMTLTVNSLSTRQYSCTTRASGGYPVEKGLIIEGK